jgi:ABC-type nitrate/sulfonate/bicarbonate transport system substrate-binding protein
MMNRRQFLRRAGAGAALTYAGGATFLAACGGDNKSSSASGTTAKAGTTSDSVQFSWVMDAEFSGYYIAKEKGYYAAEGLDTSVVAGGPNVAVEGNVQAGKSLFGLDAADTITKARLEGAPFMMLGAQFQKNPLGVMSLKEKNILKPSDLEGKTLGVPAGSELIADAFLKTNKIDKSAVTYRPYGFDPTPIGNGELDAALAFVTTDPYLLKDKGIETNTFLLADFGYNVFNDLPFVTEDTLKNKRDEVVKWLRASIKGWQDNIADPSYVVPLIVNKYGKDLGFSNASQQFQNETQIPLMQSDATKANGLFWMSDEDIAANVETMNSVGIKADPAFFTRTILEEIYAGKSTIG